MSHHYSGPDFGFPYGDARLDFTDLFFCDVEGTKNNLQFTGDDFFADKDVCSIALEAPNSALGSKKIRLWARTLVPERGGRGGWVQVDRGALPAQTNVLTGEKKD